MSTVSPAHTAEDAPRQIGAGSVRPPRPEGVDALRGIPAPCVGGSEPAEMLWSEPERRGALSAPCIE